MLNELKDVYVWSVITDDVLEHYKINVAAGITTNFKDKDSIPVTGVYKAEIEFAFSPENGLIVIAGDFIPNKPYSSGNAENTDKNTEQQDTTLPTA